MMIIADLHVHTNYSHDSNTPMEQYAIQAIDRGIDIVCFTDHYECNRYYDTTQSINLAKRAEQFHRLKAKYSSQVKLLLGVEFGEPHLNKQLHDMVLSLGLDMIIGSIHYPLDVQLLSAGDSNRRYYERMYDQYVWDMVSNGGIDVLGHIDLPKRYNSDYVADTAMQQQILQLCVQKGIVPEVNTSSVRRGLDPMPNLDMITYYQQVGGKYIVVNSDSHRPCDLGAGIADIVSALPRNLCRCYFENRVLKPLD